MRFDDGKKLWRHLKAGNEISLTHSVLTRVWSGQWLIDGFPSDRKGNDRPYQQPAELTRKDPERTTGLRHETAMGILGEVFDFDVRRWMTMAKHWGLPAGIANVARWIWDRTKIRTARQGPTGEEPQGLWAMKEYAHINAAFLQDLLAHVSGSEIDACAEAAGGANKSSATSHR